MTEPITDAELDQLAAYYGALAERAVAALRASRAENEKLREVLHCAERAADTHACGEPGCKCAGCSLERAIKRAGYGKA